MVYRRGGQRETEMLLYIGNWNVDFGIFLSLTIFTHVCNSCHTSSSFMKIT